MTVYRAISALVAFSCVAFSFQDAPARSDDADRVYHELTARLQKGDFTIDFRALRFACSAARDCEVRGNVTDLTAKAEAGRREDWATERQICEKLLSRGYADLETHAELAGVFIKLGDSKLASFHLAVVAGLNRSIRANSGETKETAMEVISAREISMMMVALGLPYVGNEVSSRTFKEGTHQYRAMEARDPKTNQVRTVYFNLDHVNAKKDVTNRP